ncbi:MAG: HD domain-containing protein [Chloroflexi bacterium]|nr:HD domain-containing protein [Chloroflexota bacterium]
MGGIVSAPMLIAPGDLDSTTRTLILRLAPLLPPGEEPHAVGGFVRDALLGRATHDLDITVLGNAQEIGQRLSQELGGSYVPLDEERQVARVAVKHQGQPWQIDLAALQGDRLADLARRDFTVDAMSVPLEALLGAGWPSRVLDPLGGRQDLEHRLIRQASATVFQDDGARLLRAVRLAAQLGFRVEEATQEAIRRDAPCITRVSGERIRDELLATLATTGAMEQVYVLDRLDLLCRVLPELALGKGVTQPKEHRWDVFRHNVETVGTVEGLLSRTLQPSWALEPVPWNDGLAAYFGETLGEGHTRATLLKLAGLLHDVAKPSSRSLDPDGRIRFFGHHTQGAAVAKAMLERLRMSRRTIRAVEVMVEHHLRPGQMRQGAETPTPKAVYRFFRSAGEVAVDTLYLNLADYLSARGPMLEQQEWAEYTSVIRHVLETGLGQHQPSAAVRLLDGDEIMSAFQLPAGPLIGTLLEAILEAQATEEIRTKEDALALARNILATSQEAPHA